MTLARPAGSKAVSLVIGTGVGGLLAQSAVHFPSTFPETGLFGSEKTSCSGIY